MFYITEVDKALRFGDVISGFISSIPDMKEPNLEHKHPEYNIELSMPEFSVILSPCCSIGEATITLAPLVSVMKSFYKNPYFSEDLTRLNRQVEPEKAFDPITWENFSEEEKKLKSNEGVSFVFLDYFIYGEHEYLPRYPLKLKKIEFDTGFYMIDFRKSYRVHCSKIQSAEQSPYESKILQLSVDTRKQLRNKISSYYLRAPKEDLALLESA